MITVDHSLSRYHQSKEQIDDESVLVEKAQRDSAQFAVLYKKYFEQIFLFNLKRVESEDIAADVTSQVFLKALTNLKKYKSMGLPFSSWLFRIARNELFDLFRKNKIEMVVSLESNAARNIIAEVAHDAKESNEALYQALHRLDTDEMELIEFRFFEKRPFKEIAEILDITESNAKIRTYRVLDKLKKLLQNER